MIALQVTLQYIYLGYIDAEQQKDVQLLACLISQADYLQIGSLARACQMMLREHLLQMETSAQEVGI